MARDERVKIFIPEGPPVGPGTSPKAVAVEEAVEQLIFGIIQGETPLIIAAKLALRTAIDDIAKGRP